jgi:hypothetical protein
MRYKSFLFLLMTAGFIFTIDNMNGIGVEEAVAQTPPPGSQSLVVNQAPPSAPKQDVIPPQPSPQHVWQPGYWTWKEGNSWVWVPGRWEAPPYPYGTWIPGHWSYRYGYYHWVPGHWAYY